MADHERQGPPRRCRCGRPPRSILRQSAGRGQRATDPAAHSRRRAAGLRRSRLPRLQHRPDHEARPVLAGFLLPVLRQQGRRVPPARGPGRAPGQRIHRGARPAHARPRRLDHPAGLGRPLRRDPRSIRAGLPCVRKRRRACGRGAPDGRGVRDADPRPLGDDDSATAAPRPRDPAAPRVPEPHARHHGMVRSVRTDVYPGSGIEVALTDVMHRTLFGVHDHVNVHAPESAPPPALASGSAMFELIQPPGANNSNSPNSRVLDALLDVGPRRVRRARLPQHARRRSRRRRGRFARRLLPVLPQQGRARAHADRTRGRGRGNHSERDPRHRVP